jgi:hypothetical protein
MDEDGNMVHDEGLMYLIRADWKNLQEVLLGNSLKIKMTTSWRYKG